MGPQILELESEALDEFRVHFSFVLSHICRQMVEKKLPKGVVTGKIAISISEKVKKETGEIYYSMKIEPDVKMKMATDEKFECGKQEGIIMQLDGAGRPVIASEQIGMDELNWKGA